MSLYTHTVAGKCPQCGAELPLNTMHVHACPATDKPAEFPPRAQLFFEADLKYLRDCYVESCPPASAERMEKVWKHKVEYLSLAEHQQAVNAAMEGIEELRHQCRTWERLAREWNEDYDKLKEKYEPMIAVISEAAKASGGGRVE